MRAWKNTGELMKPYVLNATQGIPKAIQKNLLIPVPNTTKIWDLLLEYPGSKEKYSYRVIKSCLQTRLVGAMGNFAHVDENELQYKL